jgi:Protein of unknown function (DUF3237)
MTISVSVRPVVDLGGGRRFVPFADGTFTGVDGLEGTVLDGGVDWQVVRADGVLEIDAHYALRTDAGDAIEVRSSGVRKAPAPVLERIANGEPVAPEEYYFRTHIRLSTAADRLARLNEVIAVSTGERERDVVHIHVHEVL